MVNVLIADDNVNYAINLMNYINNNSKHIRVCNIAKNGKETLNILNTKKDIDVVLLDYKMPFYNGQEIIEKLNNKEKYLDSFIIISGEIEALINMRKNELIHSIIYKTCAQEEIVKRINELIDYKEYIKYKKTLRQKIINELSYLCYDFSYKGTKYLIDTIEFIALNFNDNLAILEKDVYPIIATRYNETVNNIKCRINKATTCMYYNCEVNKLKKYLKMDIDIKPKIKSIITIVINNIE